MANYSNNKKSIGLKGGPNEYITNFSDFYSLEGYKADSPDVNNPYNIINSGNITMEGVDFPVIGTDNLGNRKLMTPGNNYQFPGDQVFEVPMAQAGREVPKRKGVRLNYDKEGNVVGESTHIMRTETDGKGNWFSFPTLFQNEDGTWVDMSISLEEPWEPVYQEALKRGEVIDFGTNKEAAIKFGEGSWKKKLRRGGSLPRAQEGFELNQTSANPFIYGDWAEISRSVNPTTGATTIIDERTGNRDVEYSKRGVNWKVGYENWLAAGNKGSLADFKIEAERWKKSQTKNETDVQNRERTEPGDEASITGDFYGSGIGNTKVPAGPNGTTIPNVSIDQYGFDGSGIPANGSYDYTGAQGNTTIQPLIPRPATLIDQPEIPFSSQYPGGLISPRGGVLPDSHVDSTSSYEVNSKKKNNGNEKLKQTFLEDTTVTNEDGYSNMNIKSVNNGNRERLKQEFNIYDKEDNLLATQVDKTNFFGNPKTKIRVTDEGEAAGFGLKYGGSLPEAQLGAFLKAGVKKLPKYVDDIAKYIDDGAKYVDDYFNPSVSEFTTEGLENATYRMGRNETGNLTRSQLDDVVTKRKAWVNSDEYIKRRGTQLRETDKFKNASDADIAKYINDDVKSMENAFDQIVVKFNKDLETQGIYSGKNITIKTPDGSGVGYSPNLDTYLDVFDHEVLHAFQTKFGSSNTELLDAMYDIAKGKLAKGESIESIQKALKQKAVSMEDISSGFHKGQRHMTTPINSELKNTPMSGYGNRFEYLSDPMEQNARHIMAIENLVSKYGYNYGKVTDDLLSKFSDDVINGQNKFGVDDLFRNLGDDAGNILKPGSKGWKDAVRPILENAWMFPAAGVGAVLANERDGGEQLPQAQIGKGLDYVSGLDGNVIMHEDEALQNANQKNLDSAKDFAGKWMNSPRYLEMLNNSGGSEWWNRAGDVQRGRISNFNELQDAPLYISNDPNQYYSEKALSGIAGYSESDTGKIYVKPKSGGRAPTLYDHEISHSIDRPADNFLLTDIVQFYARGMDPEGRLIPNNDIDLMGNLIDPTLDIGKTLSFWESYGDTPEEGTRNYYSDPTEVRARLNEIRKDMKVNGVDVFNKEITYDDMPTSRVKAFRDLKRLYSEESILQMLNTISDTGTLPDADTLPVAQGGVEVGPKEAPEGYKWNGKSLVPNDWSEFHDEVDKSLLDFNNILAYVSESRGGTEEFWGNTADTVAFHESGAQQRMDRLAKQISQNEDGSLFDGPGRGVFQFEGPSLETAQTRYKNIARAKGFTLDPEIINATSADLLPMDKQYTLFFANLIESDATLSDYSDGKMEQVDLWLQGHKNIEKPGDRASFQESVDEAKKKGITGGYKSFKKRYGGSLPKAQDGSEFYPFDGGYESGNDPNPYPFPYGVPVDPDTDNDADIVEEEVDITQLSPLDINLLQPPIISIQDGTNLNSPILTDHLGRDINDLSPEDLEAFHQELNFNYEQDQRDQELIDQEYIDPNQIAGFVTNANQRGQNYERGFEDFTERSAEDVQLMQGDLLERGYDIGPTGADGIYGQRTHDAYSSMIADAGLEESAISRYDKKYNPETYTEVKAIQTKLIEKGFLPEITEAGKSNIDGKFGERTKMALLDYNTSKAEEEEDVEGLIFDTIPTTLEDERCAAGMCQILELNDIETEAIGVKYKDAWDLLESMKHVGNSAVQFNIYDDSLFDNVDENTSISELKNLTAKAKRKHQTTASNYKVGDIVGIYWPGSDHHLETLNSETHNTHSGFVSSIDENGTPIITHNVGGTIRNVPYNEVATAWISRPNENIKLTATYAEQIDPDDIALSQTDSALIDNFENKIERSLTDEERKIVSNIMQRANYNSKHIPEILNSSIDQEWLNAAIFGITGVETGGGINAPRTRDDLSVTRALAHMWENTKDADISLGVGKTKYNSLDNFARNYFEINSPADLADDNKAVDAVSYMLVKNYELFKNYAQQYPTLGLAEEDVRNMTLLSYNQGVSKLLTTGRNDENTRNSEEELAALRELYEGSMADISSTNYSRIPGGESLYDAALVLGYETPSEKYISKTNRYITEVYGGSDEYNDMLLATNITNSNTPPVLAKGGEYGVFKNYVNGDYNNTPRDKSSEKVFDKLNRRHYKEAKALGMSPSNYIMSHLVG